MDQQTVTLVVAGLGIAGTLAGTIVGNAFQARGQHQQWRRDHRSDECRELLSELAVTFSMLGDFKSPITFKPTVKEVNDSIAQCHRVLGSRLLIAPDINEEGISKKWTEATTEFMTNKDFAKFENEYIAIRDSVIRIGLKH